MRKPSTSHHTTTGWPVVWVFFAFALTSIPIHPGVKTAFDSIKVLTVRSTHQKITDKNQVLLDGEVEILLDYKVHIWADRVVLDKERQTVVATCDENAFVKFENPDFVMLADSLELCLATKTGCAKNIKIHVKEGFLSSAKAEKLDDQTWEMEGLAYTACDHSTPHWSFTASHAVLYKNSVLKASGLLFKIMQIPVFVFPVLVFPLQNRAGSGFLMPRLSFDAELGFGFRQEYYWLLGSHCDTTFGFNLVEKKGFILSDEFRWAKSSDNFIVIDSHYAEEWDAWLERDGRLVQATDKRYWVQGNYFQPFALGTHRLQSLIRFDFGTDKRLGYQFLNDAQLVEDSFYNSVIQRYHDRKHSMQFVAHSERSLSNQFVEEERCLVAKKREHEEKVSITYLPHYEWGTSYYKLLPFLHYRHDMLFDYAFLESKKVEKFYVGELVDRTITTTPSIDIDTARFVYKGRAQSSWTVWNQHMTGFVEPQLQLRSNVCKTSSVGSRCRLFARCGFEWAFPEQTLCHEDYRYMHHMQPIIRWGYLPKIYQDHWYHIDMFDRFYPENRLVFILRNNWRLNDFCLDLVVTQGYDFCNRSDIFPLRRSYSQKHLAPLHIQTQCTYKDFDLSLTQEYDWKNFSLATYEIMMSFARDNWNLFLGYIYQKDAVRRERELFSDISTFVMVGCSVPLGNSVNVTYNGKFYSKHKHALPLFNAMKPMLHHVCFDYKGHCWGISIGWEEKRYRQYGNWKSERALTLSLRLESIGSFAQKFKRLPIYRAPEGYER
ncbi:hypothetical protein KKA53_00215 [Candidatus Dependentiae bacterium]|nr:hypothetical protein [Candidatus Dependentiae bacterium]